MRVITILSVVFILLFTTLAASAQAGGICPGVVEQALTDLGTNCASMSRNSACYGFNNVEADFNVPVDPGFFTSTNERADLLTIDSLQTGKLDLQKEEFGVSLLSIQANIPDALPGQGVVFVLVGGTKVVNGVSPAEAVLPATTVQANVATTTDLRTYPNSGAWSSSAVLDSVAAGSTVPADAIDPTGGWVRVVANGKPGWIDRSAISGDLIGLTIIGPNSRTPMQAFFFRTGIGGVTCDQVPSLLAVQGPRNASVDITAQGVDIRIGSTIVLQTLPAGANPPTTLQITTVSGLAIINPDTPNAIYLPAGFTITVPLGPVGADGFSQIATGPWSAIRALTQPELALLALLINIPGNVLDYVLSLPTIVQASGVGGVVPQFVFADQNTRNILQNACNAGVLSPAVCAQLGL